MEGNEMILQDRCDKIREVINKYGEDNFFISFSGGRDSTVLSYLIDLAIPGNKIPRVFANTGIELNMIRDFVKKCAGDDERIIMLKPSRSIRMILDDVGYPFKSKEHSYKWEYIHRKGFDNKTAKHYLQLNGVKHGYGCPNILRYQFFDKIPFKISDRCCDELKKKPIKEWCKQSNRKIAITGVVAAESNGGSRMFAKCTVFSGNKLKSFQPLVPVTRKWEDWFIDKFNVKLCDIYRPPYNFTRTGCKGCPFNPYLQKSLDTIEEYFPAERKQCEIIWKPVYDEYRRIGYRLRKENT